MLDTPTFNKFVTYIFVKQYILSNKKGEFMHHQSIVNKILF